MSLIRKKTLKPRKQPLQARSTATVEMIYDAAIQVLLKVGVKNITTTRVAERAGVSVGTLYQYYPNIQSLLAAVLERHLSYVADAMTTVCARNHHKPLAVMMRELVDGFVVAKTAQVDISKALYAVNSDLNCADIVRRYYARSLESVQAMLATVTDYKISDVSGATAFLLFALTGPMKEALEAGAPPKMIEGLRHHLFLLAIGYMKEVAGQSGAAAKATTRKHH